MAYDNFTIRKLGRTFSALPMQDVLRRASPCTKDPEDIEEFIVSMVMSNTLKASLSHYSSNHSSAMLRFCLSARGDLFREEFIRAGVMQRRLAMVKIAEAVAHTDKTLEVSQENLYALMRNQRSSDKPGTMNSGEATSSVDMDEDLMGRDGH